MTRDEAIKILKGAIKKPNTEDGYMGQALTMAIKALEQQTCEDAISREDALMALTGKWTEPTDELIHRFIRRIKKLPSVNPAEKQELCEDAISRQAVEKITWEEPSYTDALNVLTEVMEKIRQLPSVNPQPKTRWIPVSERLPKVYEFVNCTCHSLIDDREDWVVETCYIPQPHNSSYSDWGNIPMLNWGQAEVIAWMYRDIPKPYKAESEDGR